MASTPSTAPEAIPSFQANPYALLQAQIQRRQAIADALQAQALQGRPNGEMVSGHYVSTALPNALQNIVGILAADRMRKGALGQEVGLQQQYLQAQQGAMEDFLKDYGQNGRQAVVRGLASWNPAVQNAAGKLLEKSLSGKEGGDLSEKFTPDSVARFGQTNNPSDLVRATLEEPGKVAVIGAGANTQAMPIPGQNVYGPIQMGPNNTPMQQRTDTGQANFGHPGIYVNQANLPPNVAAVKAIEHAYERLDPLQEQALSGQQAYSTLQSAQEALKNSFTGTGAGVNQQLTAALQTLGFKPDQINKLGSTALLRSALTQAAGQLAKSQTGARVSNYEEQLFQKVGGANPNASPQEIEAALSIGMARAANNVQQYNRQLKAAGSDPDVAAHLGMYTPAPDINPEGPQFTRDPQTGLYRVNDAGLQGMGNPTQAAPGTPSWLPPGAKIISVTKKPEAGTPGVPAQAAPTIPLLAPSEAGAGGQIPLLPPGSLQGAPQGGPDTGPVPGLPLGAVAPR